MASVTVSLLLATGNFQTDSDRAAKALEKLGRQAQAVSAGLDKQIGGLQLQAATFGLTARQATLFELSLKGASDAQLKTAESALSQVEAYNKIQAAANGFQKAVVTSFKAISLASVAAAGAFEFLVNGAGNFQDLSDRTGVAAVDLASLSVAAGVAGVSMSTVGDSITLISKSLTGIDEPTKKAGQAIQALGINLDDLKKQSQIQQFDTIEKAFNGFADGANKAALANAIFKGSGQEVLALFKELDDEGGRHAILTDQQIAQADEFTDKQKKAAATLRQYAEAASTQAIPAVQALTGALGDSFKQLIGVDDATGKLGQNNGIQTFARGAAQVLGFLGDQVDLTVRIFEVLGRTIGGVAAAAVASAQLEFRQAGVILSELKADNLATNARPTFSQNLDKQFAAQDASQPITAKTSRPTAPSLPNTKATTNHDDPTKKLLDNELKAVSDQIRAEEQLLGERNKFLNLYNDQGLLSIKSYYDTQLAILDAATTAEAAGYAKQKALLEANRDAPGRSKKDQADDQGKLEEIARKQAELEQKAAAKAQEVGFARRKEIKAQSDAYVGLNAQVLELQGNLSAAAGIKFDKQYETLSQAFNNENNEAGLKLIATLRAASIAQANLNKFAEDYALITGNEAVIEDRITLKQQTGKLGELEGLKQIGEARQQEIPLIQAKLDLLEQVDTKSRSPAQVQQIEQYRLALEKLKATVDPLALKLNGVFEDSFGSAFSDFITGATSARKAADAFFKSVASQLASTASKDIAHSIFGGDGGIGGFISKGFGQNSSASSGSGINVAASGFNAARDGLVPQIPTIDTTSITTSLTTLQTTGLAPSTAALGRFQQAIDAASASVQLKAQNQPAFTQPVSSGGGSGLTTGDFTRTDHGDVSTVTDSQTKATASTDAFTISTQNAALTIANLAQSADKGNTALSLLPAILALAQSSATASAASSVGKGLGSWFSGLFGGGTSSGGIAGNDISLAFSEGGYTGSIGAGEPAGIVHGNEFVFSAPAVRSIGVDRLDHLHSEAKLGRMRGYATGGLVNDRFRPRTAGMKFEPSSDSNGSASAGLVVQNHFAISGPIDRRTQQQIAAQAGRSVRDATVRGTS